MGSNLRGWKEKYFFFSGYFFVCMCGGGGRAQLNDQASILEFLEVERISLTAVKM